MSKYAVAEVFNCSGRAVAVIQMASGRRPLTECRPWRPVILKPFLKDVVLNPFVLRLHHGDKESFGYMLGLRHTDYVTSEIPVFERRYVNRLERKPTNIDWQIRHTAASAPWP
jgi:hypothetical protein